MEGSRVKKHERRKVELQKKSTLNFQRGRNELPEKKSRLNLLYLTQGRGRKPSFLEGGKKKGSSLREVRSSRYNSQKKKSLS